MQVMQNIVVACVRIQKPLLVYAKKVGNAVYKNHANYTGHVSQLGYVDYASDIWNKGHVCKQIKQIQ